MANDLEAFQQLKAAYEANKAEVAAVIGSLNGKINDLKSQLVDNPNISAEVLAFVDEIAADTAALHESQTAPE